MSSSVVTGGGRHREWITVDVLELVDVGVVVVVVVVVAE